MRIDCRNLECPEPIIRTKDALEKLKIGDMLEVIVNDIAPKENIKRFLNTNNISFETNENGGELIFVITKTNEIQNKETEQYNCQISPNSKTEKIIYLNEDTAGSGEVGKNLLSKFLGAILNVENKPKAIICVNNAVFMTTDRSHVSYQVLKNLEANGIEIYSCGSCLEAYKIVDKLSIGKITNAYEVMDMLTKYEAIKL
ncbi:selenium metabolism protein [Campylobacter blaseri]|uniref:Sulfurtransferase-like selenium metabolism protein YedF n=1 Tax=Campylobacter blaseri TaxID=2042961 RepID=A0A2P8R485_9BACT|nr:sulfurtransferase-like selenium metabolism protein YedF [Campylobacter blaseri]PSM53306.1 sulfurtransferase-like selenium metabolism protein YedF [Campylobacter blaseri]PSM54772.1 sulfurtransferase-like selenium metabolism protein YedF [Campylobacter blaseri]QKF86745.1 selenium metabolism protein [Campylobacter blaseri]